MCVDTRFVDDNFVVNRPTSTRLQHCNCCEISMMFVLFVSFTSNYNTIDEDIKFISISSCEWNIR